MSQPLPPRPDLGRIRKQAKALIAAHRDARLDECRALQRLGKYAALSTTAFRAARPSLADAQHALALEHGFGTWAELKREVERRRDRPTRGERIDDGDRRWLSGLEHACWGGITQKQNTIIAAVEAALTLLGTPVDFIVLMGVSGAAFRLQFADWCNSAPDATQGFDCTVPALAAYGYDITWYRGDDPGLALRRARAIAASIDAGRPAIVAGNWGEVIVGYEEGGHKLWLRRAGQEGPGYQAFEGWSWQAAGILSPRDRVPPRDEVLRGALQQAVELSRPAALGEFVTGFRAYDTWIERLTDEAELAALTPESFRRRCVENAWHYLSHADNRRCAGRFLRAIAPEFGAAAAHELTAAGTLYHRMERLFFTERDDLPMPFNIFPWDLDARGGWTPQLRSAQGEVLHQACALERKAIAHVEAALEVLS